MKIVLLGKNGQVGWELQRALPALGTLIAFGRETLDLEDLDGLTSTLRREAPDVIVNAAAYTAVDKAESEPERAQRINAEAVAVMADEAARLGAWLVHYSTDYVFDGTKAEPYVEHDTPRPLSVYGATKLAGENAIRERHSQHLMFRTSWVFGNRGANFAKTMLRLGAERESLRVVADQHGTPTSAAMIADITALALHQINLNRTSAQSCAGTYHLAAGGATTWWEYARYVLQVAAERGLALKVRADSVEPISTVDYPTPATRPLNSRLATNKLTEVFKVHPPDWRFHVERLLDDLLSDRAT